VERLAALCNIDLRTGCFCNPGACAQYLGLAEAEQWANFEAGHVCWDDQDVMAGKPTGAVRASFGFYSSFEDCQALLRLVEDFLVERSTSVSPRLNVEDKRNRNEVVLQDILIYPIKSCSGFRVEAWPLTSTGLLFDREWMLTDTNGRSLTQKKVKKLAHVVPSIDLRNGVLRVHCDSVGCDLELPLHADTEEEKQSLLRCRSRGRNVVTCTSPPSVSDWFHEALGVHCTLVRRQADKQEGPGRSFANEGHLLLISVASVADLNKRLQQRGWLQSLDAYRFRPNLVIRSTAPYEEDDWRRVRVGENSLEVMGGCARCEMVNIEQSSGESSEQEPLLTLATYRRRKSGIFFGVLLQCNVLLATARLLSHQWQGMNNDYPVLARGMTLHPE